MEQKEEEIEKFRAQIDIIDQTILELIGKRHNIANRIGTVKKEMQITVLNADREKKLLDNIKTSARTLNIDEKHVEEVWREIMKESKKIQQKVCG